MKKVMAIVLPTAFFIFGNTVLLMVFLPWASDVLGPEHEPAGLIVTTRTAPVMACWFGLFLIVAAGTVVVAQFALNRMLSESNLEQSSSSSSEGSD